MFTGTTETAIQALILIGANEGEGLLTPRYIAKELDASPSYMAKITGSLVKAGVLKAQRGALGGVCLKRAPKDITMLSIVEACQGKIVGDYCDEHGRIEQTCAFHQAMLEIHVQVVKIFTKWTLADLMAKPCPAKALIGKVDCRMGKLCDQDDVIKKCKTKKGRAK